ncbi:FMN-dependent NADH-azoreductase [Rudaeicoccus suwonensis]|uniref:FMN dependent NADH:quinone oxidoreductase n=1 Tax=Rudaeicoccus suwonensis TaxID=657409 RepID=A0A561E3U2_9MICO|nr:NAD(P)H-dependent oxidoreductase [Rudaeicoccus suwonensis]TWE10285.1 FMN-dependent NADH-azoreductase [Rudaeicoccus suwonensis]
MSTLLHISSSPRDTASDSLALAQAFLDSHQAVRPEVNVETVDLFDGSLPQFGRLAAGAKMAVFGGGQPTPEQSGEWDSARTIFDRFADADSYLFSVPMWNGGVPYVLKQWIDIITQPGWAFGFDPATGYSGLLHGKKAAVVYTSGVYSVGAPPAYGRDFHSTFFTDWLHFVGIDQVTEIRWQPTVLTATRDEDRAAALERATEAGRTF